MREDDLLSVHEAANEKGVPVQDIRNGIESGALTAVEHGGVHWIDPSDLTDWEPHPHPLVGDDFTAEEASEYLRNVGPA